jgi:hypothetical protein
VSASDHHKLSFLVASKMEIVKLIEMSGIRAVIADLKNVSLSGWTVLVSFIPKLQFTEFAELNIERRRKRKIVEQGPSEVSIDSINDPLIADLMRKEKKFLRLLTSSVSPIHNNLGEALSIQNSAFDDNYEYYELNQLGDGDQMNFSYW